MAEILQSETKCGLVHFASCLEEVWTYTGLVDFNFMIMMNVSQKVIAVWHNSIYMAVGKSQMRW